MSEADAPEAGVPRGVGARSLGMLGIAAASLLVGVMGVAGAVSMVSDGLGITRIGNVTGAPQVGTSSAPPAAGASAPVVAFGVARGILAVLLVIGAVGTLGVRRSGRRCSLLFAAGWIVLGGIEPLALGYLFGWPVVVSAVYPFLLLLVFNSPSWKAAFAGGPAAAPDPGAS